MPSIPRVVVVDAANEVARVVRGALTLLNRQHILVEIPSADIALEEILNAKIDLVVTAYKIPGSIRGLELAVRISRESLGTPVIVLADQDDPELDEETAREAPFQYFVRPVAEPFLRGLRIALDGEAAIAAEKSPAPSEVDLGPVPAVDIDGLRNIVVPLMRDVGAMGVILADRTGRILIDEGATGYIDRERLAVVMGPSFARSADVSPLIGGKAWAMHYYDGERLDVFGLSLGIHYFLCLIFEGSNRGALGAVMMFGRRAADQMIDKMGEVAFLSRQLPPSPPPKAKEKAPEPAPVPTGRKKKTTTEARVVVPAEPAAQPVATPVSDFDPERLFGQSVDEQLAQSMFDLDTLSNLASSLNAEQDERVGYDEAIDMGILNE